MNLIDINNTTKNEKENASSEMNIIKSKNEKIFSQEATTETNIDMKINQPKKIAKFKIPQNLQKTFRFIIILTIIGIILFFCGLVKAILNRNFFEGIFFWILAILVLIPGGFYSFQFIKAKRAKTLFQRQEILDKIPKLENKLF